MKAATQVSKDKNASFLSSKKGRMRELQPELDASQVS